MLHQGEGGDDALWDSLAVLDLRVLTPRHGDKVTADTDVPDKVTVGGAGGVGPGPGPVLRILRLVE